MLKVRISSKGQVVIPKPVRERLGLREGTELTLLVQHNDVVLRKTSPRDWRRWGGRFPNSGLVEALAAEHREEIERDA
jgi:AbrB family looped-hinge helix DNA binding protein